METGIKSPAGGADTEWGFFEAAFHLKKMDAALYSPLVLAYLGDAVYEVLIRTLVVNGGNMPVNKLHKRSASLVKAAAQAKLFMAVEDELTEEERAVYKRGRNAKPVSMAKNATVRDYRMATGFEALAGYLYLAGRRTRLVQLVSLGLEKIGEFDGEQKECMLKN
ncbi:MAG: ribonuclease III [Lachnospiraceae bacterium]|nr:ribonuclease III [Lachnospiraceae bacterium]